MAEIATQPTATSNSVDNGRALDALLSSQGEPIGIVPEPETPGGAPPPEPAVETDPSQEAPADQGAEDAPANDAEPAEDESALAIQDGDRDYSEAAYKRAAAFFGKKYGTEYDPVNNASHRAMLRDRLDELDRQNQAPAEPAAREEKEYDAPATQQDAPEVQLTPAQLIERYDNVSKWAESQVVPEVAGKFANEFVNDLARALWPDKEMSDLQISPEAANRLTQRLTSGVAMVVGNLLPVIMKSVPDTVNQAFPQLATMHNLRLDEAAFETVGEEKNSRGTPAYPHLQELVENGALKREMKAFEGKTFDRDPVKNQAEKIRMAYLKAVGGRVNPEALQTAAKKGAEVTEKANQRAAAGRMTPGASKGTFAAPRPDAGKKLMESLGALEGDKFGAAVAASTKR